MKKSTILYFLFFLLALQAPAIAQQGVTIVKSQRITGKVRWSGNILIRGDVEVAPSGFLQIAPGTTIRFAPNLDTHHSGFDKTRSELIIKGTIFSRGTIDRKIVFTSAAQNPRMQDWAGIVVLNGRKPAIFEFAIIEYAYNGLDIKKSDPIIQNCQIQFNYNAGLKIAVRSKAKLIGNIIRDNGYAGVICETGAQPILTDNLITKNQIGVIVFGTAQPNLGDLTQGPNFNPGRNALFDNLDFDLYNHSSRNLKAEGNSWGSKDLKKILAQIYDKEDADRFGSVDFNPIMGNVDLFKKMILAQQVQPPKAIDTTSQAVSQTPSTTPAPTESLTGSQKSVIPPAIPKQREDIALKQLSKKEEIKPIPDSTKKAETEGLALNKPSKETVTPESVRVKKKEEAPKINYNQVFLDVFLDKKVKVLKKKQPIIDDPTKGMNDHGKVVVRVVVNRQGKVEEAKVLRGLNYYYDRLALDAAKKFKFEPGRVKGIPVRFSTSILFVF